jgi:hypothetical protein
VLCRTTRLLRAYGPYGVLRRATRLLRAYGPYGVLRRTTRLLRSYGPYGVLRRACSFAGGFLGPLWPGIVQAHFDFGIAAGYVNSGQRVYHGRSNSTALSRLEGKSNVTVGATAWVCSWSRSPAGFRPLVRQAGTYQVCGWLAAGYHFN